MSLTLQIRCSIFAVIAASQFCRHILTRSKLRLALSDREIRTLALVFQMESDEYDSDEVASAMMADFANPWANAGSDMFSSFLSKAKEDRLHTKIQVKNARFRSTAQKTEVAVEAAWNRFQFFRVKVLNKNPDTMPTTEDIQRFLIAFADHVKVHNPTGVPSIGTMKNTLSYITMNAKLKFEHFSVTPHAKITFENTLRTLLADGTATAWKRAKFWVTSSIMVRLVHGTLVDSYNNGSSDWDRTIADCLLISLQSALGCRMGDLIRTDSSYQEAFLKFSDITIFVKNGSIVARICLRWTKGTKDDPISDTSDFELQEVQDRSVAVGCPIQLLVAYALRTGAVAETSFDELWKNMSNHPFKELVWAKPTRPVFCQRNSNRGLLPGFDSPMTSANAGNKVLSRAARVSGLPAQITTHDIRRGTALEVSRLPLYEGLNVENARHNLGHHANGPDAERTLADYVGFVVPDTLARRLDMAAKDPPRTKRPLRFEKPEPVPSKRPRMPGTVAPLPPANLSVAVGAHDNAADHIEHHEPDETLCEPPPTVRQHQVEIGRAMEDMLVGAGSATELDEASRTLPELLVDDTFTSALRDGRDTWITFLSSYNVLACLAGVLPQQTIQETSGGSRDMPTLYRWSCSLCNSQPGGWPVKHEFDAHTARNHSDGGAGAVSVAAECDKVLQTPVTGENHCPSCGKQFDDHRKRRQHIYEVHTEIGCPVEACNELCEGILRVKQHWYQRHCDFRPMACPITNCTIRKPGREEPSLHSSVSSLLGHLRVYHKGVTYEIPDSWKFPGFKSFKKLVK